MNLSINGFGRIGRCFLRQSISNPKFKIVAINDLVAIDNLIYLLKHDTVYG
jgi:glyceraldehyde 3-phosphate dehydrogenase